MRANRVLQHSSTPLNPFAVPVHVQLPAQPQANLAGPGIPPTNGNVLQRSPPNARTRFHVQARRGVSATRCTDADADEDTRTSAGNSTAMSLGAGLREMWAKQTGKTLSGPGVPPSPPRLSRRAKGKWKPTERSPPPSPTGPAADLILGRFCTLITIVTANKEGDQGVRNDAETDDEIDAKKRKQARQDACGEENGLLTRAQLDIMVPRLRPHLGSDYPKGLADPPNFSQKDIDAPFPSMIVGLKPFYGALGHDPQPLDKESSDFGGNDKGPMTRSKSRRHAHFGVTDGATEVPKERKEMGRSKQGTKRKRTADDDSVATATPTATTGEKGKTRKAAKTKLGEKVTDGAVKTNAKTHEDAPESSAEMDSPRAAKRVGLTVPRTPAKAQAQAKAIRLPPHTRAERRARDSTTTSPIKLSLNENEGEAVQETDKDEKDSEFCVKFEAPRKALTFGIAEESAGPLSTSVKSNDGGDVSKATSDKKDEDTSTAAHRQY